MTMISMILTVYVTEEDVLVGIISYFWTTEFCDNRQNTEHI